MNREEKAFKTEPKPPIGVMPSVLWKQQRAMDLARAIHEYIRFGKFEPVSDWIDELRYLLPSISQSDIQDYLHGRMPFDCIQ